MALFEPSETHYEAYVSLFDYYWEEKLYEKAVEVYDFLVLIPERAIDVGHYFEQKGRYDRAIFEYETFTEWRLNSRGQDAFPNPLNRYELVVMGWWYQKTEPEKAERYLRRYLKEDMFKDSDGCVLSYKKEAEEILTNIINAKSSTGGKI